MDWAGQKARPPNFVTALLAGRLCVGPRCQGGGGMKPEVPRETMGPVRNTAGEVSRGTSCPRRRPLAHQ